MKDVVKGYLLAFVSAFTYGIIPLFMIPLKKLNSFSVDSVLFYRFLIASFFILLYLIYQKENIKINFRKGLVFSVLGVLYALSAEFLFIAYDFLSPGIASTIFFIYPIIVAVILGIFFKEKITFSTAISLIIVVIGVGLLSVKGDFQVNYIGLSISLLGALSYALYIILVNKTKINASGIKISFYSMLFSSVYFFIKTLFTGETLAIPSINVGLQIVVFAVVTTSLSVVALVYAIRFIGSTPTAIMGAFEPIVAVMISVMLFGENLTSSLILGGIIIITGVLLDIIFRKK
ncbi:MAG: DMT family transporter [Capnocytophaga sp.]|nr:DMT family transporter [Capnocytophaga sp.]